MILENINFEEDKEEIQDIKLKNDALEELESGLGSDEPESERENHGVEHVERGLAKSDSSLVTYTRFSPNFTGMRGKNIDCIVVHHTASVLDIVTLGNIFANPNRTASSNYGIGNDGTIGLFVHEWNRAWTTGTWAVDSRAVTIEVSNNQYGEPWGVGEKAMASLIKLVADICKRNDIKKLVFTGKPEGSNLLAHRWFQATACPGTYLYGRFPYIVQEVNKLLTPQETPLDRKKVEDFVTHVYRHALYRKPDSAGLKFWSDLLVNKKITPKQFVINIFNSPEYANKYNESQYISFIIDAYHTFLGRGYSLKELMYWADAYSTKGRNAVLNGFGNSAEFKKLLKDRYNL